MSKTLDLNSLLKALSKEPITVTARQYKKTSNYQAVVCLGWATKTDNMKDVTLTITEKGLTELAQRVQREEEEVSLLTRLAHGPITCGAELSQAALMLITLEKITSTPISALQVRLAITEKGRACLESLEASSPSIVLQSTAIPA